ncbi:hypothetical protein [Desulforhopalus singaporensis]|uniref:Uncharacterized protein n=1 Tax=Desulforhopalus singaporensis TaxID=91360 RepID=A0A1H0VIN5_9BACT|nr:hypothetical protein [Desulforhopalus singaporensis]SDP78184.1 hypothetical protein SAMN05660330_04091 [Desulforhopalus singaporensis]
MINLAKQPPITTTSSKQPPITTTSSIGVVSFLDVLGWKGIWQRKQNAIHDLEKLVKSIRKQATQHSRGLKSHKDGISSPDTKVLIISDTILIFTEASHENATPILDLHGLLCQHAIPDSIMKGIPIRGATSFGEVILSNNNSIFAGKAIDEAASWHEAGDWIGVFMSPTASFVYKQGPDAKWIKNCPPIKNNVKLETFSVDWRSIDDKTQLTDIKQSFCELAPITPDIVKKFTNTINYLEADPVDQES